jgi:hypothetical protein
MKKLFVLSAIFVFSFSKAQISYSIQPSKSMTVTAPYSSVTIFDIYQKNTSTNKIILKWERVSINLPSQWQYSMCDFGSCYPGIPVGPNTMDTVPGNGNGFLGLNIDPGTTDGTGIVKVFVYQNGFHSNGDTLTWYIKTLAAGVEELTANSGIKIFPNPAQNNLNINLNTTETANVYLMDALGRQILTSQVSSNASLDISTLDKGFYTLVIQTKDKQFFKRVIKE